jgi:translation initiation factor IF-3
LIDENNKQIGMINTGEALRMAEERGFDLVEVSPKANPPVCKLLDYGAYQYRLEKVERKQKAKQKIIEVKGIRLSFKIGAHDLEIRKNQALKFIEKGDKVKLEMILRGREMAHQDMAREIISKFIESLGEKIIIEQPLTRQGNRFSVVLDKKR